jgi:hypothetical protein
VREIIAEDNRRTPHGPFRGVPLILCPTRFCEMQLAYPFQTSWLPEVPPVVRLSSSVSVQGLAMEAAEVQKHPVIRGEPGEP